MWNGEWKVEVRGGMQARRRKSRCGIYALTVQCVQGRGKQLSRVPGGQPHAPALRLSSHHYSALKNSVANPLPSLWTTCDFNFIQDMTFHISNTFKWEMTVIASQKQELRARFRHSYQRKDAVWGLTGICGGYIKSINQTGAEKVHT